MILEPTMSRSAIIPKMARQKKKKKDKNENNNSNNY